MCRIRFDINKMQFVYTKAGFETFFFQKTLFYKLKKLWPLSD